MYSCFGEGQDSWTFCLWRSLRTRILRGWAAQLSDLGPPFRPLRPGTLGGTGQDLRPLGGGAFWGPKDPVGGRAPPPVTRRRLLLFPPSCRADT